ncbi:MAG: ThuA domain-containing protein [candidate division Zixibacteria bacterium]|nr:ThuA domain-containing protein [candidate division Zixibacteria bacterium]
MDRIRTLILSGANNHDWRRSTPFLWLLLQESGRFETDVTLDPSQTLADASELSAYQLIVSDYNGPAWSEPSQKCFETAIRSGVGLTVLHAADNAFDGWSAYERMVGLLWREGTGHGRFHEFPVTITDPDHPITKGMSGFRTTDELYHRLAHLHDVPYQTLATGFSSVESGGTGREEPVMVVTRYGEGRIYHHVLGHVWSGAGGMIAFENEGFKTGFLRGCEWAATGGVAD